MRETLAPPKSWWTPTVSRARDKARFWFRMWTDCGRQVNSAVYACYCEARRSYRRACRLAARAAIDEEARILHSLWRDRNISAFWRRVDSARRGGQQARSELSACDFADHFGSVSQEGDLQLSPSQLLILYAVAARFSAGCVSSESRVVSPEEVSVVLRRLNPRPAGGGAFERPPLRFFEDSEKTAARSAAGFSPTLPPIFSATFVKISTQCHVRSGHRVRSSDPTTK